MSRLAWNHSLWSIYFSLWLEGERFRWIMIFGSFRMNFTSRSKCLLCALPPIAHGYETSQMMLVYIAIFWLHVTQKAVVSCILWKFVSNAACYVFSKMGYMCPSVRCSCRQHCIWRSSNHYLFFLRPYYRLTRLYLEELASSRWNEGEGRNYLLSRHYIKMTIFSHYSKQKTTFVKVCRSSGTGQT